MFSRLSCCGSQPCTQPSVICFTFRAPCVPNRETSRDFLALGRLNPRFGDSSHFCTAALSAEAPMLLHLRGLSRCSCEETSARLNLTSPIRRARSLAIAQRRITSLTTNDTLLPLSDQRCWGTTRRTCRLWSRLTGNMCCFPQTMNLQMVGSGAIL
jgi:hypothetical protein